MQIKVHILFLTTGLFTLVPPADSVDQDQTKQNVQSDLNLHYPMRIYTPNEFEIVIFGVSFCNPFKRFILVVSRTRVKPLIKTDVINVKYSAISFYHIIILASNVIQPLRIFLSYTPVR